MNTQTLNASGVHLREIKGLRELKDSLPDEWFGYTSLEMIDHRSGSLEIDLIICTSDRLIVVEIKDWNGTITSAGGRWQLNGNDKGKSPVQSVIEKRKKLASALRIHLANCLGNSIGCPWVDSCVLLTGSATREHLPNDEQECTFSVDFFKKLGGLATYSKAFPHPSYFKQPLRSIKPHLDTFFLRGDFKAVTRYYSDYLPEDTPFFRHPQNIYQEFFATKKQGRGYRALLRLWDFDKLAEIDTAYANQTARTQIAFREADAIGYLKDVRPSLEKQGLFLRPLSSEGRDQVSTNFYELYDLPKDTLRLEDFIVKWGGRLRAPEQIDLARTLISHVAELHDLQVAHRDLGGHNIWVERPSQVSISGFATASFPEQKTINEVRETIRAGSAALPEDILGDSSDRFRRDVFLLACCVHQIIFGRLPQMENKVPQWQSVPDDSSLSDLAPWFEKTLEWDPKHRIPNAIEALAHFRRCEPKSAGADLTSSDFDSFAGHIPFQQYPFTEILSNSSECQIYKSISGDSTFLVKVWFSAKFQQGNAGANFSLLSFLRKAQALKERQPAQCARIHDFGLSPVGLYLVQRWHEGATLQESLSQLPTESDVLSLCERICQSVHLLHGMGIYHEDIKPSNIVLPEQGLPNGTIVLIDVLDYQPAGTQRHTPAYSPPNLESASAAQIDVHATATVVMEIIDAHKAIVSEENATAVKEAARDLLASAVDSPDLSPLIRAISAAIETPPPSSDASRLITIKSSRETTLSEIRQDNGILYVSIQPHRSQPNVDVVYISGAADSGRFFYDKVSQTFTGHTLQRGSYDKASLIARKARWKITHRIGIIPSDSDDYSELCGLLPELTQEREIPSSQQRTDSKKLDPAGVSHADVPRLWKSIIDREENILPEATVAEAPEYNYSLRVYSIRISELSQPFDYTEWEEVEILSVQPDGRTRPIGTMDVSLSTASHLVLKPLYRDFNAPQVNSKVRIQSKLHKTSLDRRRRAVERIIEKRAVVHDIIDCVSGRRLPSPTQRTIPHNVDLGAEYNLNPDQEHAFTLCLGTSPLSLVQGPPGTGKTHLIAAFVHYLLKHTGTQNILLVSQSHEAVNNAADKIISLFEKHDESAPIVRIGMRNVLTDELKPYHTSALRDAYGKRFRADLGDRIALAARDFGLPEEFVREFYRVRRRLEPMLRQLSALNRSEEGGARRYERLAVQFRNIASRLHEEQFDEAIEPAALLTLIQNSLISAYGVTNPRAAKMLQNLVDLSMEWSDLLTEETGDFDQFLVKTRPIVTGTCVGVGRWNLQLESNTFDWVIIDEAARCDPGELAVAMQVGANVVLVGDHLQLPPSLDSDLVNLVAQDLGVSDRKIVQVSDFQRIFSSQYGRAASATLSSQYRMAQPIGELVSSCFYSEVGGLTTMRGPSPDYYQKLPAPLDAGVVWLDTGDPSAGSCEEKDRYSYKNEIEADAIVTLLQFLTNQGEFVDALVDDMAMLRLEAGLGVIASYRAQSQLIRQKLLTAPISEKLRKTCKVDTVDSYQGKENPIIVVSLTRSNLHGDPGFVRSAERINVSLSRAMERLIIVGSRSFWRDKVRTGPLKNVISYIEEKIASGDQRFAVVSIQDLKSSK